MFDANKPNKISGSWIGPGKIETKIFKSPYIVDIPRSRVKAELYHINILKPYFKRTEFPSVSNL